MPRFEIIPSIDLLGGQAVRLRRGDYETSHSVADDPIQVAREFTAAGAPRLHIVDLDGARGGSPENQEIVRAIVRAVSVPVQVGGGVRTIEAAERLFEIGVDRVIVGTAAAQNDDMITRLLEQYAGRVVVGADARDGRVAVHGWQSDTGEYVEDFGRRLAALGARRLLFTDVSRDGMLEGPNIAATAALAAAAQIPVIASGGVSGVEDVKNLAGASADGIEGVIIGKALYSGRLTVAEAIEAARTILNSRS